LAFPKSAWLVAREELKALKRTTFRTFFKVLSLLGYETGKHFNYNAQDMTLTFANNSVVFFAELKRNPSDPEFNRIGSYDLTGAWIDEAQEICKDAKDVLQFRFTVMEGEGWKTVPKTLYTCNPSKTWIYSDFWRPLIKEKIKIDGRYFITSLYSDNPYIDQKKYKKNVLKTNNKVQIERLLRGNFEYDDDPTVLMEYETILDLFTNEGGKGNKYISCDVARFGEDRTVICYWEGLKCCKVDCYSKRGTDEVVKILDDLCQKHQVRRSHVVVDEDGVGGGVVDNFKGCVGFVNNSSPLKISGFKGVHNYANLKTQCYFKFSQLAKDGKIRVDGISVQDQKDLIEELGQVKQKDIDKDGKIALIGKETMKENLGRSPDIADALMMRMFFELKSGVILKPFFVN
jgi:hypothetical protein